MDRFIVEGGVPLKGEVVISGSKNASLPIIAGALLCEKSVVLRNLPDLRDIRTMLAVLKDLGSDIGAGGRGIVAINTPSKLKLKASYDLVKTMRASFVVAGPLLARWQSVWVPLPGGCAIGTRPVDLHLKGFEALGAKHTIEEGFIKISAKKLRGATIWLDFPSVGATENIMMAACLAEGETVIENAAREPEVSDLADFLNKMGANISGAGTDVVKISGVSGLAGGGEYSIIPDRIEAGTFMTAAVMTRGRLSISGVRVDHLEALIAKFSEAGIRFFFKNKYTGETVAAAEALSNPLAVDGASSAGTAGTAGTAGAASGSAAAAAAGGDSKSDSAADSRDSRIAGSAGEGAYTLEVVPPDRIKPLNIRTFPYPGFPTDMQSQTMAMLCLASGTSTISERIFENRFMHVAELRRMGAKIDINGDTAIIEGIDKFKGAPVMASDLRAGAALVLAALGASGKSEIQRIYHLDRGYEAFEHKLMKLGAKISRVN